MERGSIALLHTMVSECSETYKALPKQIKLAVIRNFSFLFSYLNRCYMSAQYFPEMNDPRLCVHFGYYLTQEGLRDFFESTNDNLNKIADIEQHIK